MNHATFVVSTFGLLKNFISVYPNILTPNEFGNLEVKFTYFLSISFKVVEIISEMLTEFTFWT